MFTQLLGYNDVGLLLLRLALGFIFIYHGLPKLYKYKMIAQGIGKSGLFVFVLGLAEVLPGIGLVLGVWVQLSALVIAFVMVGATWTKITKWHVPFHTMERTGWEFDFILFFASIALLLGGGGSLGL